MAAKSREEVLWEELQSHAWERGQAGGGGHRRADVPGLSAGVTLKVKLLQVTCPSAQGVPAWVFRDRLPAPVRTGKGAGGSHVPGRA